MKRLALAISLLLVAGVAMGQDLGLPGSVGGGGGGLSNPPGTALDMNGDDITTDTDGDSKLELGTDDQVDVYLGGAADFRFAANDFTALSGSAISTDTLTDTSGSGLTCSSDFIMSAAEIVLAGVAQGTCDASNRGRVNHVQAGAGVTDTVDICIKNAADAYAWTDALGSGGGLSNPPGASLDMNGDDIITDLDGDSRFELGTDDEIQIYLATALDFLFQANTFTASAGSTIKTDTLASTSAGDLTVSNNLLMSGANVDVNGNVLVMDADADLSCSGAVDDNWVCTGPTGSVFAFDSSGSSVNSPLVSLRGDVAAAEVEGTIQLIQGADPSLLFQVDDDSATPVLTDALTLTDTRATLGGALVIGDPGTRPTCDATEDGAIWYDSGTTGSINICKQTASVYAWDSLDASGAAFNGDLNGDTLTDSGDNLIKTGTSDVIALDYGGVDETRISGGDCAIGGCLRVHNEFSAGFQVSDGSHGVYHYTSTGNTLWGHTASYLHVNLSNNNDGVIVDATSDITRVALGSTGGICWDTSAAATNCKVDGTLGGGLVLKMTGTGYYALDINSESANASFQVGENGTKPTCASGTLGLSWFEEGTTNQPAVWEMCVMETDGTTDTYSYRSQTDLFAEANIEGNSTATTVGSTGAWLDVDDSGAGDIWTEGNNNGFDWELANDEEFTALTGAGGLYLINYNLSFTSAGTNKEYRFAFMVDDGVTPVRCGYSARFIGTGSDVGNTSGSCIIQIDDTDEIGLQVYQVTATAADITVQDGNLVIRRL